MTLRHKDLDLVEPLMAKSGKPYPSGVPLTPKFDVHSDPIAIALKRLHEEVEAEPIPSDFLDLLAAIDRKMDPKAKGE
jgi:Anti-sigma factor NepR